MVAASPLASFLLKLLTDQVPGWSVSFIELFQILTIELVNLLTLVGEPLISGIVYFLVQVLISDPCFDSLVLSLSHLL